MNCRFYVQLFFYVSCSVGWVYGQSLSDIARTFTAPITAPIETTINILKGDDPKSAIMGPYEPAGRVISKASDKFQRAHDVFNNVSRNAIESTLGSDWRKAYEALSASNRVQFELTTTTGRFLGKCLQGHPCSVDELVAGPLAAALRDAYKVYYYYSYPLPPQVVNTLSRVMPYNIAANARWAVARTPDFTIPGFLNYGYSTAGQGHAVTIGNVMIFTEWPNLYTYNGWQWLLHELFHIEQYAYYHNSDVFQSIDGFAVEYIKNYNRLERAAENIGTERANLLCSIYYCQ